MYFNLHLKKPAYLLLTCAMFFAQAAFAWHNAESVVDADHHSYECTQCLFDKNSQALSDAGFAILPNYFYSFILADYIHDAVSLPSSFSIRAPPLTI